MTSNGLACDFLWKKYFSWTSKKNQPPHLDHKRMKETKDINQASNSKKTCWILQSWKKHKKNVYTNICPVMISVTQGDEFSLVLTCGAEEVPPKKKHHEIPHLDQELSVSFFSISCPRVKACANGVSSGSKNNDQLLTQVASSQLFFSKNH